MFRMFWPGATGAEVAVFWASKYLILSGSFDAMLMIVLAHESGLEGLNGKHLLNMGMTEISEPSVWGEHRSNAFVVEMRREKMKTEAKVDKSMALSERICGSGGCAWLLERLYVIYSGNGRLDITKITL